MMVTTKEAALQAKISQRGIQKRIKRLGLKVKSAGGVLLLSSSQLQKVKDYVAPKPGPKPRK